MGITLTRAVILWVTVPGSDGCAEAPPPVTRQSFELADRGEAVYN